ncbi:MAG: hypothetical protein JW904_06020 [Spirochaetales bacterium]|nr:hypothetical protein [Spirochaetales bacterium]
MKKIIFVAFLSLVLLVGASAQSETGGKAGQIYLGLNLNSGENQEGLTPGPIGIFYGVVEDTSLFVINATAEAGYCVIDGLFISAVVFANFMAYDGNDPLLSLGVGAGIGYIFDIGGSIAPFIQLNGMYLVLENGSALGAYMGFKVMPIAGIKVFFNSVVALDLGAFFSYSMLLRDSDEATLMFGGLRLGVDLFL